MQWVIFDVGGTLIEENKSKEVEANKRMLSLINKKFNTTISLEEFLEKRKLAINKSRVEMSGNADRHKPEIKVRYLLNELGIKEGSCVDEFVKIYRGIHELMPDAIEVLDYLKGKYHLAVISNGFKDGLIRALKELGMYSYFDEILTSGEYGEKSTLKPFKIFLERTKANTKDCWMIGNRTDEDIVAKKLGIKTILFTKNLESFGEAMTPDYTIDSLLELKKIL